PGQSSRLAALMLNRSLSPRFAPDKEAIKDSTFDRDMGMKRRFYEGGSRNGSSCDNQDDQTTCYFMLLAISSTL
ncbi:hypothetical protein K4H03_29425, partial [Mycobacterium tuberculosis]|nr:hypothetical protein [Mycobacterium tuberculosis]